jgi:hypothetical protein
MHARAVSLSRARVVSRGPSISISITPSSSSYKTYQPFPPPLPHACAAHLSIAERQAVVSLSRARSLPCAHPLSCTCAHLRTRQTSLLHLQTLSHTVTHCHTLQHTATHCNTLQHPATHRSALRHTSILYISTRICVRVCVCLCVCVYVYVCVCVCHGVHLHVYVYVCV